MTLIRAPSIPQARCSIARASSLTGLRRSSSLASTGRRPSLECHAVQRPAHNDPERLPEAFSADSGFDWDLDASVMPWPSSFHSLPSNKSEPTRSPLMFYPSTQNMELDYPEEGQNYQIGAPMGDTPCFVILFGVGEEDLEGIYTLRTTGFDPDSLASTSLDTVVAFENEVDAQRFSTLLEASLVYKPSVYPISWAELTEWCNDNNNRCRLEPAGSLLIPPESHVERTDWEHALALQRGEFKVLDSEPILDTENVDATAVDPVFASKINDFVDPNYFLDDGGVIDEEQLHDPVVDSVESKLLESELADVRASLEKLLQQ